MAVLCESAAKTSFENLPVVVLDLGGTAQEMAARLYRLLREAEKVCDVLVTLEPNKTDGVMVGVLNRLRKACVSTDIAH